MTASGGKGPTRRAPGHTNCATCAHVPHLPDEAKLPSPAEEESVTSPTVLTSGETEAQKAQETHPASHSQSEAKLGCCLARHSSSQSAACEKWPWTWLGAESGLVECWKQRPGGFEAGAGRGVGFVRHGALPGCSGARASGQESGQGESSRGQLPRMGDNVEELKMVGMTQKTICNMPPSLRSSTEEY